MLPDVLLQAELLDLLERNPKLGTRILFKLAWTIGERLKSTNEQLRTLSESARRMSPTADRQIKDKPPSLVKIILLFLAAACIVAFLFLIPDIVRLVVIAALLSYILDPLANVLEARGMSRTKATVTIFLAFVTLLAIAYIFFSATASWRDKVPRKRTQPGSGRRGYFSSRKYTC